MRGKLRPSEDDVKARLKPYYNRTVPSKHSPRLIYATFSTLDAAVAALYRSNSIATDVGLVVEAYECATLESSERKHEAQSGMFDKLDECGVNLNISAKSKAMSSRTVEVAFPKPQLGRAFALNTLYRPSVVILAFRFIRPQPAMQGSSEQRADAPSPYIATWTPLVLREIEEKPSPAREDSFDSVGKAESLAVSPPWRDSAGAPIRTKQMLPIRDREKPETPRGTIPDAPSTYSIAPTRRR